MTQGPEQAPAGWYPDPHAPEQLRYFDGVAWTNHFHQPGRLPGIGDWLNSTFSVFAKHWMGALGLTVGASVLGSMVVWFAALWVLSDVRIVDESLEIVDATQIVVAVLIVLLAIVWQGVTWLAVNRFLQRAHYDATPTITEAITHGFSRFSRYLGALLGIILVFVVAISVVAVLVFALPIVGFFAIAVLFPLGIFALVKLTFLAAAVVAAPADTSAIKASANVSTDRFWPVLGRIILMALIVGIGGNMIAAALGPFGSAIDQEALAGVIVVTDDGVDIADFRIGDLLPGTGLLLAAVAISSVLQAVSTLISTSAYMRLYLDSGGPSDLSDGGPIPR